MLWLQAVSLRPLIAEARFRSQVIPCEVCGWQSGTGVGFPPSTSVLSCQYHSSILHISHSLHVSLTRRINGRSLRTCKKAVLGNRGHWIEKIVSLLFMLPYADISCRCGQFGWNPTLTVSRGDFRVPSPAGAISWGRDFGYLFIHPPGAIWWSSDFRYILNHFLLSNHRLNAVHHQSPVPSQW
jgi:hypothetical protein